jgi:hypothetical protein
MRLACRGFARRVWFTILLAACSSPSVTTAPQVPVAGRAPYAPDTKSSEWSIVSSPNVEPPDGVYDDVLYALSGVATNDIWTVGNVCCYPGSRSHSFNRALIEHWNGSKWKVVPFAKDEPADTYLFGVAQVSHSDVWAVGKGLFSGSQFLQPLFEHWNGKKWSLVQIPDIMYGGEMYSAVALSSDNVWAAGDAEFEAATEHWNGKSWSFVPGYSYGVTSLRSIAASGPDDIWAVGEAYGSSDSPSVFTEHWNGSEWSYYPAVDKFFASGFYGVADLSPTDVWAVGYENPSAYSYRDVPQTLIEHWDGYGWNLVPSPNKNPKAYLLTNWLFGVAGRSASDVWAVGYWTYYPGSGTNRSLFLHWNGKKWRIASGPPPLESGNNATGNQLLGIVKVGSSELWAIGSREIPSVCCEETLTARAVR